VLVSPSARLSKIDLEAATTTWYGSPARANCTSPTGQWGLRGAVVEGKRNSFVFEVPADATPASHLIGLSLAAVPRGPHVAMTSWPIDNSGSTTGIQRWLGSRAGAQTLVSAVSLILFTIVFDLLASHIKNPFSTSILYSSRTSKVWPGTRTDHVSLNHFLSALYACEFGFYLN
jgi:hypothetical protein